jgi:hypothetical protein
MIDIYPENKKRFVFNPVKFEQNVRKKRGMKTAK